MSARRSPQLRPRDLAELAAGAVMMAFPIAVTEEVWNLGSELSLLRVGVIALGSILAIAVLIWALFQHGHPPEERQHFVRRVVVAYGFALGLSALILLAIDRLELLTDPILGLKRTVLVTLPASFAATAVDSLGD